jgi:hypothetical protein
MASWRKRTRSASKLDLAACPKQKRTKVDNGFEQREQAVVIPVDQSALLLHATKQPYSVKECYEIPALKNDSELLVSVEAVGLNPIDWKAP